MKTIIKNGTVVNSEGRMVVDILVKDGKIACLSEPGTLTEAENVIDATGKYILPGAIDTHAHIEEPFQGLTPEENWTQGTRNAAMGGVTTVLNFIMQQPDKSLTQYIREEKKRVGELACLDFNFHGVFTDYKDLDVVTADVEELFTEGVTSVKAFMIYTNDGIYADDYSLFRLMKKMSTLGGIVGVHAENMALGETIEKEFIKAGKIDSKYWPQVKPNIVEAEAVSRACMLAEEAGCRLYIVHTSAKESVDIIKGYRQKGLPIYSETCTHYLVLDESIYSKPGVGVWEIISPPLRKKADQERLWKGIKSGEVVVMGSDHNAYGKGPKDEGYKKEGFKGVSNGGPGILENAPVLFSEGVGKGRISLERFAEVTSTNPAKMFGLYPRKGTIAPGSDADLVIWDPKKKQTLGYELYQAMDWTAYEGMEVTGFPVLTMLRGQVVIKDGEFVGKKGMGQFVPGELDQDILGSIR